MGATVSSAVMRAAQGIEAELGETRSGSTPKAREPGAEGMRQSESISTTQSKLEEVARAAYECRADRLYGKGNGVPWNELGRSSWGFEIDAARAAIEALKIAPSGFVTVGTGYTNFALPPGAFNAYLDSILKEPG